MTDPHPSIARLRAWDQTTGKLRKSTRQFQPTRPKSKNKSREAPLQVRLVNVLRRRLPDGSLVFHVPNQRRDKLDAIKLKMMGAVAGMPDLLAFVPWTEPGCGIIALECKAKGGAQSETQKYIQEQLEALGVAYRVVTDVDAALEWIGGFVPLKERKRGL